MVATPGWSRRRPSHPNCMYMWMDYITSPDGAGPGGGVLRRGAGQPEGLRPDHRRPDALRRRSRPPTRPSPTAIYFWATPRKECLDGSGERLRPLLRVDQGLDRDQGLTHRDGRGDGGRRAPPSPDVDEGPRDGRSRRVLAVAAPPSAGPARGAHRRAGGCGCWSLYIGSLVSLFLTSLYTTRRGRHRHREDDQRSTTTSSCSTSRVYRDVALRTRRASPRSVTVIDLVLALPIAFFIAKVATARWRAPAGRRGARPAVGQLPREGLRVAGDPRLAGRRARQDVRVAAPATAAVGSSSCWPTCGCRT